LLHLVGSSTLLYLVIEVSEKLATSIFKVVSVIKKNYRQSLIQVEFHIH